MDTKKHKVLLLSGGTIEEKFKPLQADYILESVKTLEEGLNRLHQNNISAVLLNLNLPNENGIRFLRNVKKSHEEIEVITFTHKKNVEEAIQVIQEGALDYLAKDEDITRFQSVLEKAIEGRIPKPDLSNWENEIKLIEEPDICIGQSAELKKIMNTVEKISPLPSTILLCGESGTGKEILARLIYQKSHLRNKPFVTVNLPSIPSNLIESVLFGHEKGSFTSAHRRHFGKFELADGGTIFLDEIGDLPLNMQSKLLRVIQEGEIERIGGSHPIKVKVRLIAATKADLKKAVKAGKFRDDLFYRINVVPIHLPPLRKRLEDLPELCDMFVRRYSKRFGKNIKEISNDTLRVLRRHTWPGNIRELENLIERMIAMVDDHQKLIGKEDIPLEYYFASLGNAPLSGMNLNDSLIQFERKMIIKALRQNNWNRKKTALSLGISYGILKYKVRKFKINIPGKDKSKIIVS